MPGARAGALTIAELTACGVPAILVPFPHAAADHQTHNAAEVALAGAAEMIADAELDAMKLVAHAMALVKSDRLEGMRQAARALGRPDAAADIARDVIQLARHKGESSGTKQHGRDT